MYTVILYEHMCLSLAVHATIQVDTRSGLRKRENDPSWLKPTIYNEECTIKQHIPLFAHIYLFPVKCWHSLDHLAMD